MDQGPPRSRSRAASSTLPTGDNRGRSAASQAGDPFEGIDDSPKDETSYEGVMLSVTYGRQHFQPTRFQGMDIGPFTMEVRILAGETPMQAKQRAMKHLEAMADEEYRITLPGFIERVKAAMRKGEHV